MIIFFTMSCIKMFLFFGNQCKLYSKLPPGKNTRKDPIFPILNSEAVCWPTRIVDFATFCRILCQNFAPAPAQAPSGPNCSTQPTAQVNTGYKREQIQPDASLHNSLLTVCPNECVVSTSVCKYCEHGYIVIIERLDDKKAKSILS